MRWSCSNYLSHTVSEYGLMCGPCVTLMTISAQGTVTLRSLLASSVKAGMISKDIYITYKLKTPTNRHVQQTVRRIFWRTPGGR